SDESSFVTGAVLVVDGGMRAGYGTGYLGGHAGGHHAPSASPL
ncbi:MAG: 3-alpha-hydroxysteroid dehydrogenase, partial [Thermoleophilia bacterium]